MSDNGATPVANGLDAIAAAVAAVADVDKTKQPTADEAKAKQLAEDLQKAKEAGWNEPTAFDYDTAAGGKHDVAAAAADGNWLSDAAVYEWQDDFGEVGEHNPELERQLFEDPDMQRAGGAIQALEFDVRVEGPEQIHPVRNVCSLDLYTGSRAC